MARLKGLEPLTHCLEGSCSIHLSYKRIGAGDGNRTHTTSLEGWDSTIELHPQATVIIIAEKLAFVNTFFEKILKISKKYQTKKESAIPNSYKLCTSPLTIRNDTIYLIHCQAYI